MTLFSNSARLIVSNADGRFLVNPPLSVYEQTLGTLPLGDDMIMIGIESVAEWS